MFYHNALSEAPDSAHSRTIGTRPLLLGRALSQSAWSLTVLEKCAAKWSTTTFL